MGNALKVCVQKSTEGLSLLHTINNPNTGTAINDYFGYSVSMSGDYCIVGTPYDDEDGTNSGKAYIFKVSTGALLHTLHDPNPYGTAESDVFGFSVSISGDYCIVGAYGEDDADGTLSGKAYIFEVSTGTLLHTLDNPNPYGTSVSDGFGYAVSISGNYCIVGAYGEDDSGGSQSGKAYIFNVTTGELLYTLEDPNPYSTSAGDSFGYAVAISENYCVVGAYGEDDADGTTSGKAYIFEVSTGTLLHTLDNPNPYGTSVSDVFGYVVGISDTHCIVSAQYEDEDGEANSGKAYIFDVETGNLLYTLDNPNTEAPAGDYFGSSVDISGKYCIVGAPRVGPDISTTSAYGAAYVFDVETGTLLYSVDNPNRENVGEDEYGDQFGWAVALTDTHCIMGALYANEGEVLNSGKAYIYSLASATNTWQRVRGIRCRVLTS